MLCSETRCSRSERQLTVPAPGRMTDSCQSAVLHSGLYAVEQGGVVKQDQRFTRQLYTLAEAARLVGMSPSTLDTWAHGYERQPRGRPVVKRDR